MDLTDSPPPVATAPLTPAEEQATILLRELVAAHRTLAYLPPEAEGLPHRATWLEDDGPRTEQRETLPELAAYLLAALTPEHLGRNKGGTR